MLPPASPPAAVVLSRPAELTEKRAYVFLGCFVVGMLLTPPDVISQTLLALPVYCLYEIGIIMARVMVPGYKEVEAQRKQAAEEEAGAKNA